MGRETVSWAVCTYVVWGGCESRVHRDEGSDDSDEGNGRKRRERGSGLFEEDFFETEFKKRRKVRMEEKERDGWIWPCSSYCRLPQKQNMKHQVNIAYNDN